MIRWTIGGRVHQKSSARKIILIRHIIVSGWIVGVF